MKEKFLNIFLFLISIFFIVCGIILMFFNNIEILTIVKDGFNNFFKNEKLTLFFIQIFGSFIFGWGIFFFLLTVFTVMELRNTNVFGFIFWGFTLWIISSLIVSFLNKFYFFMICLGIIYGILFFPFFFSLPMKSSGK